MLFTLAAVMILYNPDMANTKSAKKNIRSSARKKKHNDMWEKRYKNVKKSLSESISAKEDFKVISEKFILLQKYLDKAVKEKVIHKNKSNRVKSNYARKISALVPKKEERSEAKITKSKEPAESTKVSGTAKPAKPKKPSTGKEEK